MAKPSREELEQIRQQIRQFSARVIVVFLEPEGDEVVRLDSTDDRLSHLMAIAAVLDFAGASECQANPSEMIGERFFAVVPLEGPQERLVEAIVRVQNAERDEQTETTTVFLALEAEPPEDCFERQRIEEERSRITAIVERVVVVYRKGGRIEEEVRLRSDSDELWELRGINMVLGLTGADKHAAQLTNIIGKGYFGFLPWQLIDGIPRSLSPQQKFELRTPVRVADVSQNEQTGVVTIYIESS